MCEKVETWLPHTYRRKDMYGVFDFHAITPEGETYYIQTTERSCHAARRKKVLAWPGLARLLLLSTNHIEVWSWRKRDWDLRREEILSSSVPTALERSALQKQIATQRGSTVVPSSTSPILRGARRRAARKTSPDS